MASTRKFILFLSIVIFSVCRIAAQSPVFNITADKDSILIGQPIGIVLSVTAPEAFINQYKWVSLPDTINHFEVVSRKDVDRKTNGGNITLSQEIMLTSFDSGRWVLPSLTAKGIEILNGKPIWVNTVPVTMAEDYHDIHDIAPVKKPFNYRPWLIGAAIAVTAGLLVWLIVLFNRRQVNPKPLAPGVPPLEEALKELDILRSGKWPETGQHKKFHDRLDDIFRRFLHRQYHTASVYETNEEVLLQLKQTGMAGGYTTEIAQALRLNNFVKFAGYAPAAEQSYACLGAIKNAVQSVKTETTGYAV